VLAAVAQGADIFDTSYVASATAAGLAACFPVAAEHAQQAAAVAARVAQQPGAAAAQDSSAGSSVDKLNLWWGRAAPAPCHAVLMRSICAGPRLACDSTAATPAKLPHQPLHQSWL
jgi:hypothetical protein